MFHSLSSKAPAFSLFIGLSLFAGDVHAWGLRGHHAICDAATFLVQNKDLRGELSGLGPRMGHLCAVPDTHWRSLPEEFTKLGNPGHFINPENAGKTLESVSGDFSKLMKDGGAEVASKVGSSWWRAKQFFDLAVVDAKNAKKSPAPKNPIEEQNNDLPYNKSVYMMIVNMGLLGHFVGDVSMPFHNRIDYDGRAVGHGGIHAFYEETCVNFFGPELPHLIFEAAFKLEPKKETFLKKTRDVVLSMRALSMVAEPGANKILELDAVREKSGSERRIAERRPVEVACPVYREMLIADMARSARLLASFWDEIYVKGGEPKLKAYKSYLYPFTPDFVAPDYFKH